MKVSSFSKMGRKPANIQRDPLGEHLLKLRLSAGLSQEALASAAHVDQSRIAAWERDGSLPGKESLPGLANALGVSLDELLMVTPPGARHRGPKGDLEILLAELNHLPKSRRRHAVAFLRAWINATPQS